MQHSNYKYSKDRDVEEKRRPFVIAEMMGRFPFKRIETYQGNPADADLTTVSNQDMVKTIEYKEDFYHAKSGNIFIETGSWNRPAGIVTTKANLWLSIAYTDMSATLSKAEFFFITVDMLREFCYNPKYKDCRVEKNNVGENNKANGFIFSLATIKRLKDNYGI